MKKYKMTNSDQCPRCGEVEDSRHMLWDCVHARSIWNKYNNLVRRLNQLDEEAKTYENVFAPGNNSAICLIKIKVIQALIQIERPKNRNHNKK
jgi:hypothetical protein